MKIQFIETDVKHILKFLLSKFYYRHVFLGNYEESTDPIYKNYYRVSIYSQYMRVNIKAQELIILI